MLQCWSTHAAGRAGRRWRRSGSAAQRRSSAAAASLRDVRFVCAVRRPSARREERADGGALTLDNEATRYEGRRGGRRVEQRRGMIDTNGDDRRRAGGGRAISSSRGAQRPAVGSSALRSHTCGKAAVRSHRDAALSTVALQQRSWGHTRATRIGGVAAVGCCVRCAALHPVPSLSTFRIFSLSLLVSLANHALQSRTHRGLTDRVDLTVRRDSRILQRRHPSPVAAQSTPPPSSAPSPASVLLPLLWSA